MDARAPMQTTERKDARRASQKEWLEEGLEELGKAPGALAKIVGIQPSTLTNFLKEDWPHALGGDTIQKIMDGTGWPPPPPPGGTQPFERSPGEMAGEQGCPVEEHLKMYECRTDLLRAAGIFKGDRLVFNMRDVDQLQPNDVVLAEVYDPRLKRGKLVIRIMQPPYVRTAASDPQQDRISTLAPGGDARIEGVMVKLIRHSR